MIDEQLACLAAGVLDTCRARRLTVAAAESCTGGLVSAALTAIAGSSDVVDRGFVTYSNDAKHEMLGVPGEVILKIWRGERGMRHAMAEGALAHSSASTSPFRSPALPVLAAERPEKPVGLVYLACAVNGSPDAAISTSCCSRRSRANPPSRRDLAAFEMISRSGLICFRRPRANEPS